MTSIFTKFKIRKKTNIYIAIITVLALIVFCVCIFLRNSVEANSSNNDNSLKIQLLDIAANVIIVIISVLLTTIISTYVIDIKSKNNLYSELLANDVFASPEFYNALTSDNKIKMLNNLEKNIYFDGHKIKEDMYVSIRKKINTLNNKDCYLEKCNIVVNCEKYKIGNNELIKKTIIKTLYIKSFKDKIILNNFKFLSNSHAKINKLSNINIEHIKIDDNKISSNDYSSNIINVTSTLDNKCGYTEHIEYRYNNDIIISNQSATKIEIKYITLSPITDKVYAFRLQYPCKDFSFLFSTSNDFNCNLNSFAFGFIDNGDNSLKVDDVSNIIHVSFNDWIFPLDGISVFLNEK